MPITQSNSQPAAENTSTVSPETQQTSEQPLPLPEPPLENEATKLDVSSGQKVKLDKLGPMVVNKDGTLSRIANWDHMTDIERKNTLSILGKRNQLRIQALEMEDPAAENK